MVICKFFLQGTCRFGENCKFEHQINNDHTYTQSSSILLQPQAANKPTTNVDTTTLVRAVVSDMTSAEKGGQWLLSSYAPFKEKPAFPGFEDHSMEEIRYLFYESMKNGSADQYKQNLQMMLQQAILKIRALQNPSPDAVNMLKNIYNSPPSSSVGTTNSATIFGGQQLKPVFGGANPTPSVFSNSNPPQQSIFGAPSNNPVFAAPQTPKSIFGAPVQTNQSKSIFGGNQQTTTSMFNQQPNSSIFGQQPGSQQTSNSIFGQQPQQQPVFANQSPFAAATPPQQTMWAPPNANVQFVNNPPANQFVQNPFAAAPQPTNQFPAAPGPSKPAFQHTQSIFGNLGLQPGNNMFGGEPQQPKVNEEFYSKLEDLTEDEIKWFRSDDLDISKIPEKPPTYDMCFKM